MAAAIWLRASLEENVPGLTGTFQLCERRYCFVSEAVNAQNLQLGPATLVQYFYDGPAENPSNVHLHYVDYG